MKAEREKTMEVSSPFTAFLFSFKKIISRKAEMEKQYEKNRQSANWDYGIECGK